MAFSLLITLITIFSHLKIFEMSFNYYNSAKKIKLNSINANDDHAQTAQKLAVWQQAYCLVRLAVSLI